MENGDLKKQLESLHTVGTSADTNLAAAEPAATESAASVSTATKTAATERIAASREPLTKESLWQRLRKQPRETAAVVVLVVTAIIWLDSGDSSSKQSQASKSIDPMEGFESYLSDFETEESGTPLRESADPADTQSPASFGGDLMIPQTQQAEFASTVTANYGDSVFEPSNPSNNNQGAATTAAQYPVDADAYGSQTLNNSGSQQNRKVRFAGRIKPAN